MCHATPAAEAPRPPLAQAAARNVALALGILLAGQATAAGIGDPAAGQRKAQACAACHGPDGNSINPEWPKLAGQHARYLVKQMEAFKSGARRDPLMSPQAAALSPQDIEDIAAFYARQEQR